MTQFDGSSRMPLALPSGSARPGFGGRLMKRMVQNVQYGHLKIVLPSGLIVEKIGAKPGPEATIVMHRWRALRRLVMAGDIGFAEGFLDADWTTPDLTSVIRFAAQNTQALSAVIDGHGLMRFGNRLRHRINANTKRGSRRNIEAHYDLGNDFYKHWLDPGMLYSSAIYDETTLNLESAQKNKLDRIRQKLALNGGESVLEIGCGWGALSVDLATQSNAQVVGLTLSPSQLAWAKATVQDCDLSHKVDLRLQDYREVDGKFDRIVSIEMFEAVGEAYWPSYFDTLKRSMKHDGRAVLQIISIEEKRFEAYRGSVDFIQKYVFPGGFLPSDKAIEAAIAAAGLRLVDIEHFGRSYALTLAEWRTRFEAHWPAIAALGFDERFRRLWRYYLCYCVAGFEEGSINVGLYTLEHASMNGR